MALASKTSQLLASLIKAGRECLLVPLPLTQALSLALILALTLVTSLG